MHTSFVCLITQVLNSTNHSNTFHWLENASLDLAKDKFVHRWGVDQRVGVHTQGRCVFSTCICTTGKLAIAKEENTKKSTWSFLIFCCKSCTFCNHSLEYEGDDIDHFLVAMLMVIAWMCFLNLFAQLVHFALPARRGPLRAFVNKLTLWGGAENVQSGPGKNIIFMMVKILGAGRASRDHWYSVEGRRTRAAVPVVVP